MSFAYDGKSPNADHEARISRLESGTSTIVARDVDATSVPRTAITRFEHLVDHTSGHVNLASYSSSVVGGDWAPAFTAAIAALPSTGGTIQLPHTPIELKSNVAVAKTGVQILGAHMGSTIYVEHAGEVFTISGASGTAAFRMDNLAIEVASACGDRGTSAIFNVVAGGADGVVTRVRIAGFATNNGVVHKEETHLAGGWTYDTVGLTGGSTWHSFMRLRTPGDFGTCASHFLKSVGGVNVTFTDAAIDLDGSIDTVVATGGGFDAIGTYVKSAYTSGAGPGFFPRWLHFTNVLAEGGGTSNGFKPVVQLDSCLDFRWVNGYIASSTYGVQVGANAKSVTVADTVFTNLGSYAASIANGSSDVTFDRNTYLNVAVFNHDKGTNNGGTDTFNVNETVQVWTEDVIQVAAGASNWRVTNSTFKKNADYGVSNTSRIPRYHIGIAAGASTDYDVSGNVYELAAHTASIFNGATGASIKAKRDGHVSVLDFGADPTGVADSGAAFTAAFAAVSLGAGQRVVIPAGTYIFAAAQTWKNLRSVEVVGSGNRNTILRWTGAAAGTAFKLMNDYRTTFRNIRFEAPTNRPVNLIEVNQDTTQGDYDSSAPSQLDIFDECTFVGGQVAVAVSYSGSDAMNDSHRFIHCLSNDQTVATYSISGFNAMGIVFDQCYAMGSPHAVQVQAAPGSFKWYSGYVNSSVSNFDLLSFNTDGYLIHGVRSESSPRFLTVASGNTSAAFDLAGVTYSAASLHADTFAIVATGAGPYSIKGSTWGGTTDVPPRFSIGVSQPTTVTVEGCAFDAAGSDAVLPVVASASVRTFLKANRYKTAGLVRTPIVEASTPTAETVQTITYAGSGGGSSYTPDARQASFFKIVVNDTNPFTFNAPTNGVAGQTIRIQVKATAALSGTDPFTGSYRAPAWASYKPASGSGVVMTFTTTDATTWYQVGTPIAVAN